MKNRLLNPKKVMLLSLLILSSVVGSARIFICTDECCIEDYNHVCHYVNDNGEWMCSFPGQPVITGQALVGPD